MVISVPSVLCPVDFSDASRSALCYAAAVADHFGAKLTVLAVDDPLLVEVAATTGMALADETLQELRRFAADALTQLSGGAKTVQFRVAAGKPAAEILRQAREAKADLIVISSHGRTGLKKMFLGSTTERVLRETTVPVLITPGERKPPPSLPEIARQINRVLAPVDMTDASLRQLKVAAGLADALSAQLIAVHVLEPIFVPYRVRLAVSGAEEARRAHAEERLSQLVSSLSARMPIEPIVATGEPSEEIIRLAEARQINLIVMGLHSSGFIGQRMGSVTYRVLCLTHALVLALPPPA